MEEIGMFALGMIFIDEIYSKIIPSSLDNYSSHANRIDISYGIRHRYCDKLFESRLLPTRCSTVGYNGLAPRWMGLVEQK
ncbi:hypothetical protein D918_04017 [Trichuris suis]|nr:hypothetical protein D918_04017 [Trichuris suis]